MTPDEFTAKWQAAELKERSAAQEHFIDLCRLARLFELNRSREERAPTATGSAHESQPEPYS